MKRFFLALAGLGVVLLSACCGGKGDTPLYLDDSADMEARIEDALSRMTLEEKTAILHAQSKFSSAGVPRLGIPELWTTDGPHGIRPEVLWDEWRQAGQTNDSCVAFPALTCLAASWDRDLALLYGQSIGEEALYRGKDVLLGPGVNIYRSPLCGRNFEYMGEDPYLASQMVVPYVQGVQQNGVAACVKHYCLNNEESYRHTIDVDVSDRALYEIYLPAFKAAVQQGGAWSIMGSYNLYRGQHVCHNARLLQDILRKEWGFDGAVISDWGGCHDTDEAITNGLDLEFGTWTDGLTMGKTNAYSRYHLADAYLERLRCGTASQEVLDEKCRHVLRLMMRTSMRRDKGFGSLCSDAHYAAARKIATGGIVLLKNREQVLPVTKDVKRIAVIGENAIKWMTVGGGSSSLKVRREVTPLEGIRERAEAEGMEVLYARGYVGNTARTYNGVTAKADYADSRSFEELLEEACQVAAKADIVFFFGGLDKNRYHDAEGADRTIYGLPYRQNEVIEAVAAANPRTVLCLVSGNAVAMPWADAVPSIVQVWYNGSEAGHAVADVLFGDVCPSGKLPFTIPVALEDGPAHCAGTDFPNNGPTRYEEGIYVGYRWFEHKGIRPRFAFGHGLSYTKFEYGKIRLSAWTVRQGGSLTVSVPVTNVGPVAGAEVVQLYISDPACSVERPEKELKGFEKVFLQPGETKTVRMTVGPEALQYFDEQAHAWVAEPGEFIVRVGSSSRDIRWRAKFRLR